MGLQKIERITDTAKFADQTLNAGQTDRNAVHIEFTYGINAGEIRCSCFKSQFTRNQSDPTVSEVDVNCSQLSLSAVFSLPPMLGRIGLFRVVNIFSNMYECARSQPRCVWPVKGHGYDGAATSRSWMQISYVARRVLKHFISSIGIDLW